MGLIGKGLDLTDDGKRFQVSLAAGLEFDNNDRVSISTDSTLDVKNGKLGVAERFVGKGLETRNNKVRAKLGDGLEFDDDDGIKVSAFRNLAGDGLEYHDRKLNVKLAEGLEFDNQKRVSLDTSARYDMTLSFPALTNVELFINDNILTMKKTFTRYDLERTAAGVVVGIVGHHQFERFETVTLPTGGYGYGGYAMNTSLREGTSDNPNFYQK